MATFRKFLDRTRHGMAEWPVSLAKQSFKDECDINTLMERYQRSGVIEHVNRFGGRYGDFTGVQDYQASVNQVLEAQEAFMTLPSSVRKRFDNDPGVFLDFVMEPSNLDEMVSLGLANPPVAVNDVGDVPASPEAPVAS